MIIGKRPTDGFRHIVQRYSPPAITVNQSIDPIRIDDDFDVA